MNAQDEIAQLKLEVEQLRKALGERQQLSAPNLPSLRDNFEFITDLSRFSEGLISEAAVRKKYRFDEATWVTLEKDDELVRAIEAEKLRRVRDGSFKREKSQQHVTRAPDVLAGIMDDPKQSAKHRIDSAKVLDSFSGNGPRDAPEQDRIVIRIDLGADTRAKGLESNPADVIEFEASVRPNPDPNNTNIIDHQTPMIEAEQHEAIPPRRGPGRPPGSKNKPKTTKPDDVTPPLPGFAV